MQLWITIATGVFAFLGGSGFVALLKYRAARDRSIAAIADKVRVDARKDAEASQASARQSLEKYQQTLEKIIEAQDRKIEASQTKMDLMQAEVRACEKKCEECDIARHQQQREINELRLLVMKSEAGTGTAFITADDKGVIVEWNEMATLIFGYTWREAIGRNVSILIPTRYHQLFQEAFGLAIESGVVKDQNFRDFVAMDAWGNDKPVSVRISLLTENDKRRARAEIKERTIHEQVKV